MPGITLLGLGPGDPRRLTREAWETLVAAEEIHLRTKMHPVVSDLPKGIPLFSFDALYDGGETFEAVYEAIIQEGLELGKRAQGVLYCVPGDPYVAEATSPEIARLARESGIPVRIVNGLSFLEPVFSALDLDPFPRCLMLDAMEVSQLHTAAMPPDVPLLIAQMYSSLLTAEVKMTLNSVYPDKHPVILVHAAGTKKEAVERLPLYKIDRSRKIGMLTSLFVPPLAEGSSFESFQEIVAHLRAPDGCPWDREQTHLSLRPHLMEEAYETLAAFDTQDPLKMQEELGDLLLQIVLNVQIASEAGDFNMADVIKGIHDKILHRHPHVFGALEIADVDDVLKNWEKIKAAERQDTGEVKGSLGGVPLALPALTQAQEFQDRAARVGFDWPEISGVLDKIAEEINELKSAASQTEFEAELGDLFFALVNYARWKKMDAESCMRAANLRFRERFMHIEQVARIEGKNLSDMSLEEMERHWQEAKRIENGLN